MKKRRVPLISLILLVCVGLSVVSCGKKTVEEKPEQNIYSDTVLMNGFETTTDMYKVRQHTYIKNDKFTGYSAVGKLQIVGKDNFIPMARTYESENVHAQDDMAPRQGEGALYINYVSHVAEQGGFTQLLARFANYDLKEFPVNKLGGISVDIYNDNSSTRGVTLSLVKSDLSIVSFGENVVMLEPYAWTECTVDLNPAIVEYFSKDIIGISIEFDEKEDSVYYLDNLCLSFNQYYTDEIKEYVELVKKLEKDIDEQVVSGTISLESKDILADLYKRFIELPKEYQSIIRNYTDLSTAISKYMSLVSNEELTTTGIVSLLRFDEIFGLTQITSCMGGSVSYTTEEHAPGEEGSICVEFDGSVNWAELFVSPNVATYDEIRVWVKNDSAFARIVQLNWHTLATTGGTAYDEDGNEIMNALTGVDYNNNILGTGGWIQLVFREQFDLPSLNLASYNVDTREVVACEGKLYIGKVLAVSDVSEWMKRIDAIEEKTSYTDKELLEIFDVYYAVLNLSKEQKNVLGLERVEKIEKIYKDNVTKILNVKIKTLKVKDEYSAAEIKEATIIKMLYDELSNGDKQKVSASTLVSVIQKISAYNKQGTYMDVTAYDSSYEEQLFYSVKHVFSGAEFSVKYEKEIKDGNYISISLPEEITNAKQLKIAIKNTSDKNIAFWPKVSDEQGGLWLTPISHEVIIRSDEEWVELIYDIDGLIIDSLLATYGPWENGKLQFYVGKIEVVTDLSKGVADEIAKLATLLEQNEFTAAEIQQILDIQAMYEELSKSDKAKLDTATLNALLSKISNYNKSGKNMNVLAYDSQYKDILVYSLKDVLNGEKFSMKIDSNITNKDAVTVVTPEIITGKKLTITVKNTSDKDIAFWPRVSDVQGGEWLAPTNHNENVIVKAEEGWVELTYDITGLSIDALIATYGPWENGNLEVSIGKIEVVNSYLSIVKDEIASISALLDKDEFTSAEVKQILNVKDIYDNQLTNAEKQEVDATNLLAAAEKIQYYNTNGTNMDITKYGNTYADSLYYSVKQKAEGSNYSLKLAEEMDAAETYIQLPETIYGAKMLTIKVKNTSEQNVAFFPKLVDAQGGTWLNPMNHNNSYIITSEEGWVELIYDIGDMTIDSLVVTLGPWMSGQIEFYIGEIEATNTYLSIVEMEIENISELLAKDEFTASEVRQILNVKDIYDNKLTDAEKQEFDATDLLAAVEKIKYYNANGTNMDVTQYANIYGNSLYYSAKEKVEGSAFSLKLNMEVGSGETYVTLPESIREAKTLAITVKNTSDKPAAFFPKLVETQGNTWLSPMNHGGSYMIHADEGWVELTYDIEDLDVDAFVLTLGPWESGQLGFYIGEIEVITTYLPMVQEEIENISGLLSKDEFTATEIEQIMSVKALYDSKLTAIEKQEFKAIELHTAVEKIQAYDTCGTNMNVMKYESAYNDSIYYSVKEKTEGNTFSLKLDMETGSGESYVKLPETVSGAKTLTITMRNTSEKSVAFWLQDSVAGGDWLLPTNHNSSPVLVIDEDWVELTYDISGKNIDTLVVTYGPWEAGRLELYIGGIEVGDEATASLNQMPITSATGSTYSATADGMKVDFNGSAAWCDINFSPITAGSKVHVFMKNDSDCRRIVQLNWTGAIQVLDAEGNDVTSAVVSSGNTILPANSGWLEVIYTATSASQLNCCSLQGETGGTAINGVGSLYIKGYYTE